MGEKLRKDFYSTTSLNIELLRPCKTTRFYEEWTAVCCARRAPMCKHFPLDRRQLYYKKEERMRGLQAGEATTLWEGRPERVPLKPRLSNEKAEIGEVGGGSSKGHRWRKPVQRRIETGE